MAGLRPESSTANMFAASEIIDTPGVSSVEAAGTRTRQVQAPVRVLGRAFGHDVRKWGNFDMSRGVSANVAYEVSRDDRMRAVDAGAMMRRILELFGLERVTEGDQLAFMRGLFLCHAVNSGSVLQPGRSNIYVGGAVFDYKKVVLLLGPDMRRFFRAFADEVRAELLRVVETVDLHDPASAEVYSWIVAISVDRGLQRHPELIADSASACTDLTIGERAAINRSTVLVLASSVNSVDAMTARSKTISADQFDSTNGERVANATVASTGRA